VTQRRYWSIGDAPPLDDNPGERIREELDRVSELVVRSDVPVGVALSGGIDSSVVASIAAKKYRGTLHAVTLGYAGYPRQDERAGAREVAQHLKIPIHEIDLHVEDVADALPAITWHCDDPLGDIAKPAYYFTMQRARNEGLRVMLTGHGGDELFWGYPWVRQAVHATERKQRSRSKAGARWRDYFNVSLPPYSYTGGLRWIESFAGLRNAFRQRATDLDSPMDRMVFYDLTPGFQAAMTSVRSIYTDAFLSTVADGCEFDLFTTPQPWPPVDIAVTQLICESFLIENGIAQSDRLSMASSVELRLPFLDHRLVEIVIGLRKCHRDVDAKPKQWLHDAVSDLVPESVRRRPKRGFSPPWREWGRVIAGRYGSQLADGYLVENGILDPKAARALASRLEVSSWGVPSSLADCALSLEMWCRAMSSAAKSVAPSSAVLNLRTALERGLQEGVLAGAVAVTPV
jgi:asparagine synthase (glutamine-hydrolysing)